MRVAGRMDGVVPLPSRVGLKQFWVYLCVPVCVHGWVVGWMVGGAVDVYCCGTLPQSQFRCSTYSNGVGRAVVMCGYVDVRLSASGI